LQKAKCNISVILAQHELITLPNIEINVSFAMEYFEKIYLDYKHKVYFFVKKFISITEDVEDVVQEIFVHLWKHSASLKNSQTLDSIIFKTEKCHM
jgi:DNA-directed RNA polymerase specialized sigma24 family protein